MNSATKLWCWLMALFLLCFDLGAHLQPQFQAIEYARHQSDNFFNLLLGDSSRIFANSSYTEADVYYHSGYYPTIFDNNQAFETPHMAEDTGAVASRNSGEETGFMGPPRDWLDAFGRHFIPNRHTHLDQGGPTDDLSGNSKVAEILPWLKLSSKLDPENIQTYLVMSYWLRNNLNQPQEAEQVLHEGLRYNPGNPQLLYELGRIYFENYTNTDRARTIWEAGLRSWAEEQPSVPESERLKPNNQNFDDRFIFEQLQTHLAQLEGSLGNLQAAIDHLKQAQLASPSPEEIQRQIDELQKGVNVLKDSKPASPE
jgi:tetratricopeptide (TPR) repeat protein